jgi:hypothetical protein
MRLAGEALHLQVEAERPETADLLLRDRKQLTEALEAAGYAADAAIQVTVADRSAPPPARPFGQEGLSQQFGTGPQSNGSPDPGASPDRRPGARDMHEQQRGGRHGEAEDRADLGRRGDLYV